MKSKADVTSVNNKDNIFEKKKTGDKVEGHISKLQKEIVKKKNGIKLRKAKQK